MDSDHTRAAQSHPVSRRGLLRAGGSLAAGAGILAATGSAFTQAAHAQSVGGGPLALGENLLALDLELVTVDHQSATFFWTTNELGPDGAPRLAPSDGEILVGPADGSAPLRQARVAHSESGIHFLTVEDLEPGRRYRFEARSRGVRAVPAAGTTNRPDSPERLGEFETLVPPPGAFVRSIAVLADTHVGETQYGILVAGFPPPAVQPPGLPPYPEVALTGALADARARGARHLFVNGDVTSEAEPDSVAKARELLDTWGAKGRDAARGESPSPERQWWVTRGNHDRPHVGSEWASCAPYRGEHRDCWGSSFVERQTLWVAEVGGLRVIGLDSTHLDASGGVIDREQLDHFEKVLLAEPDRPTLVMCHHPVTRDAAWSNASGPVFVLEEQAARRLQSTIARAPGAFLHLSGHTHRNRLNRADVAGNAEYLEISNVGGYPNTYTMIDLYTGGYMLNTRRISSPMALDWTVRSRRAVFGILPEYALGALRERSFARRHDFSGV